MRNDLGFPLPAGFVQQGSNHCHSITIDGQGRLGLSWAGRMKWPLGAFPTQAQVNFSLACGVVSWAKIRHGPNEK
jgi:hypothetical protein